MWRFDDYPVEGEVEVPDHTTTSAAAYLTERGYKVHSKRDGTDTPPSPTTVKQWCERGKIEARKAGWVWLIEQNELDRLLTPPLRSAGEREETK